MKHPSKPAAQAALDAQQFIHDLLPQVAEHSANLDKTGLVDLGQAYWPHTYQYVGTANDADDQAERRLNEHLDSLALTDPISARLQKEMLKIPNNFISLFGACRWFDQGLPIVRLGHKRAAALMATSITQDNLQYVRLPWPAFLIEIPPDLLAAVDDAGSPYPIQSILVQHVRTKRSQRYTWITITGTSFSQWQISESLEQLLGHVDEPNDWEGFGLETNDYDMRLSRLIGRLIAATCLLLSDPSLMKQRTESYKRGQKRPLKDAPTYRVFVEGKPIQIDARPAIRDYLAGKKTMRNAPSVRSLVRGHFKPRLGQRLGRQIWIEPYWRGGDELSPIIKRNIEATKT